MIDTYINNKRNRDIKIETRDNYLFGIGFGLMLSLLGIYKLISDITTIKYDKLYISIIGIGLFIILLSIIYPNLLLHFKKIFSKAINFIGMIIFFVILTIIYFLLVCTIGVFIRKSNKKNIEIINSTLNDYKYNNSILNVNKNSFIYQIFKLFRFFFDEKYIMLIPILIILIAIAILLVFVQSSAIAPLIYTIF